MILTEGAIEFLTKVGYDPEFGARPVKRAIQHYLLNDLSKKLLSQEVDRSKPITVDASGEGLVFKKLNLKNGDKKAVLLVLKYISSRNKTAFFLIL